eukprot:GFUD01042465.1.p1 GENE.GFUD01042465.1~~GFUD01042465.1.p1  ORF type:complete len:263 (-),score=54.48 GFUD01042465.1:99-887(-)
MNISEKFCLKWNEFQLSVSQSFQDLRSSEEFCDVTIACEDDQQIEAHKVVLAASSPFFRNILRKNKHPHPLLYLKGIKHSDLLPVLDFIYQGEASVAQEDITRFMAIAEDLKLKGLTNENQSEQNESKPLHDFQKPQASFQHHDSFSIPKDELHVTENNVEVYSDIGELVNNISESESTLIDNSYDNAQENMDLEFRIGELLEKGIGCWSCKACGKTNKDKSKIKYHVETHLHGVSHVCSLCGKSFRSRNSLQVHSSQSHRK